ncbi:MAG: ABC transporter permease [Clostridiales bacterium]|nr:ABC transporter permease [Clostridiales bacterium]
MRKGLFIKLAVSNIKRNKGTYIPYMITCICCIAMTYMMFFVTQSKDLSVQVPDSVMVTSIMFLGIAVIYIFSFIFLLYSNNFVMKRRQKEIGLYNILGLEKGHIMKMMAVETLFTSVISIIGGIAVGILGSKLALLLLLKILHVPAQLGFYVCVPGIVVCTVLFLPVVIVTLFRNVHRVRLSQPIELLRSGNTGEREPKAKWLMALLGFICFGSGYYIAVTTKSPVTALGLFFAAVLLVMAGTYLLFTAGSIAVLKVMRWKKSFYYKIKNFTSISGMIYRMKQNAMGLASICILSTGVLLMLSTTVSLNMGIEDSLSDMFPYDAGFTFNHVTFEEVPRLRNAFDEAVEKEKVPYEEKITQVVLDISVARNGNDMEILTRDTAASANVEYLTVVPEEEYEKISGKTVELKPGEILAFQENGGKGNISLNGVTYKVKEWLEEKPTYDRGNNIFYKTTIVVTKEDLQKMDALQKELVGKDRGYLKLEFGLYIEGGKEADIKYGNLIREDLEPLTETLKGEEDSVSPWFQSSIREEHYRSFYTLNGGLLFLGIFLGFIFLVGAGMIIYYKQMSEGYEDKERFEIMQKVGMSRKEVKSAIRRQILMVFFLPLLMAVLHIIMAFPMISRLLGLLGMMNTELYILCTAGTIVVFAVIYAAIYMCTAKSYYKIVERRG